MNSYPYFRILNFLFTIEEEISISSQNCDSNNLYGVMNKFCNLL